MAIALKYIVAFAVVLSFAGCEGREETLSQLNVELEELKERKDATVFACQVMHATEYQAWREENAERLPAADHLARAMCFAEEKDEDWVKAWKAAEEEIFEMDARIKSIEMQIGDQETAE